MDALTRPFDPSSSARQPLFPFSLPVLVPYGLFLVVGWALGSFGIIPPPAAKVVGVVGFYGGLLAGALAAVWHGAPGWGLRALATTGLLSAAAALSYVSPWGALGYLLVPVAIVFFSTKGPDPGVLGLSPRWDPRAVGFGLAVGLFLGTHLLISASRTWGYQIQLFPISRLLPALAYDVGANVFSAECFFRGALFGYWHRRWGFWLASSLATALSVARYLIDPGLPRTPEVVAGAFFYLSLLGLSSCALRWWRGSLFPSVTASLAFFAAYRMLGGR